MNIFRNLFRKKDDIPLLADYGLVGIDMHSHFIPGIDDGAKTPEDSLALIKGLYEMGYTSFVTTPHVMMDYFRNTPAIIMDGLGVLHNKLQEAGIPVKVRAAAEYYLDGDFQQKIGKEPLLTLGNDYLLFEISYLNAPENLNDAIFMMQANGYKPVLAHPERYPFWFHDMKKFEALKEKGVFFQMNINSLTGHYSPATQKIAEKFIEQGMIDFLGSDCHHTGHVNLMGHALKNPWLGRLVRSGKLKNRELAFA